MRSWKIVMAVGLVAAAASVATHSQPASYPDRPIRIVVPSSPGSTPDVMARAIGAQLSQQMGQAVIVENKLGANQVLGTDYVAKAAPDGYTLLLTSNAISLNPALRKLPYDALRAFVPLTRVAVATGFLVVVNPRVPVNTLQEFVAYATQHNGELNFSSPGEGNAFHLMTSLFLRANGLRMQHIPYNSINLAVNAALAGDVQMTMSVPTMVVEQIKAGKLRALAFTGKQRLPELPDVPTMAEAGVADFEARYGWIDKGWMGVFAPAATPGPVLERLNSELAKAVSAPRVRAVVAQGGGFAALTDPEGEFAKRVGVETREFAEIVRSLNIKPE